MIRFSSIDYLNPDSFAQDAVSHGPVMAIIGLSGDVWG